MRRELPAPFGHRVGSLLRNRTGLQIQDHRRRAIASLVGQGRRRGGTQSVTILPGVFTARSSVRTASVLPTGSALTHFTGPNASMAPKSAANTALTSM